MNTVKPMYEWKNIPWRKLERNVYKLQKRIFQASARGDVKTVRRLQRLLINSQSAKCLAVRRVSQDNQGKNTAGVDGVKTLTPKQRWEMVNQLKLDTVAKPSRRVWIPKPGSKELRPLSIPTMYDRAMQALIKSALEPEWEAHFEPFSFGFRPGRAAHDAIEAIFMSINKKPKYVLDADIRKCFERINHTALLQKLNTSPTLRRQIKAWLKAGVIDGESLFPTSEGAPQGGVCSPLLANIALHGIEERLKQYAQTLEMRFPNGSKMYKRDKRRSLTVVRYADDLVVLHPELQVVLKCREILEEWLDEMGLEMKPEKTRIIHTLKEHEGRQPGFDFLGFHVQQFCVGKYQSKRGYKTIITPSSEAISRHYQQIKRIVESHKSAPQMALIKHLNPVIRGWTNYYSTVCSSDAFRRLNYLTFRKLMAWARRRHRRKNHEWITKKYWKTINGDKWTFAVSKIDQLLKHIQTPHKNHVIVKGKSSPYDGNLTYWSTRMGKHPLMPKAKTTLLQRQKGKCAFCGLVFKEGDLMEIDHIVPRSQTGQNSYSNLQLLHRHCHDQKSALDGSNRGTTDKCQITEEPDVAKVTSPVLKTSGSREGIA